MCLKIAYSAIRLLLYKGAKQSQSCDIQLHAHYMYMYMYKHAGSTYSSLIYMYSTMIICNGEWRRAVIVMENRNNTYCASVIVLLINNSIIIQ